MPLVNADVAALFNEMAELLAIRGGDPHRVKAFNRAARIITNLPQPVDRMLRHGALAKTPGIGGGTIHRVKQILRRGTFDDLERLRAALPPGLRELVRLKGVGPRTARQLYQRFGINTVEQLEMAARSGMLARLPRFGVDRLHNLLREIEAHRRRSGKMPLIEAERLARHLATELADAGAGQVVLGGSGRRKKALIGDLDLLAAAGDPRPAVERFTSLAEVETVLSSGAEGASVRLGSGHQVDLWVFPFENWGAGLHAFSGSQEHVVAIRTRAGRLGLHISEHGISSRSGGRRRLDPGRREEDVFAAVGLPFIVPEIRENLGEIEAAEKGRLPRLVEAADLRGDLHLHTRWSDGSGSVREMARAAIDLGYEYLAVTDHSKSLGVANGLDERRLAEQRREIARVEDELGRVRVLAGIEVDILADGSLDLEAAALSRLDWVVASVHEHLDMDGGEMTARVIRALETGLVDCLGHPTGRKLGRRDPSGLDLDRVLETARRLGVAVEANGGPYRMDLDDAGCRRAQEWGVPVAINTDSHSAAHLARREYGLASARRGWLEKRHVLNTRPSAEIEDFRQQRLRRSGLLLTVPVPPVSEGRPGPHGARPEAGSEDKEATMGAARVDEPVVSEAAVSEAAVDESAADDLAARLLLPELDAETSARLRRYLESGDDAELEAALERDGSGNPLQQAFNLLLTRADPNDDNSGPPFGKGG